MPTFMVALAVIGVISNHLFVLLRYLLFLRTMRYLSDRHGIDALAFADELSRGARPLGLGRLHVTSRKSAESAANESANGTD
jgi:hypothetical protein